MGANNVSMEKDLNFLIISANIATLFENEKGLEDIWLKELSQVVTAHRPHFIGLHCQEVGGKDYKSSLESVKLFFKKFVDCKWLKEFKTVQGFLDGDFDHVDQYTALGNLYFVHNSVKEAHVYDFKDEKFVDVSGKEIFYNNISTLPHVKKEKFEQGFFPECKWSRKGYCRVRWKLYNKIVEFCNVHLFHDDSNLVSMESTPSVYAGNRKRALKFVLRRLNEEYPMENNALFLCGDFNFRLDVKSLVQDICKDSQKQVVRAPDGEEEIIRIIHRDGEEIGDSSSETATENGGEQSGKVIAKFEKKFFEIDPSLFDPITSHECLRSYDRELPATNENLKEFDISFGPTYPFSEDVAKPGCYMRTRCPSWCDRILLMDQSWDWLHQQKNPSKISYSTVGGNVCMGDHKPVYLSFSATCSDGKSTTNE